MRFRPNRVFRVTTHDNGHASVRIETGADRCMVGMVRYAMMVPLAAGTYKPDNRRRGS